MNAQTVIYYQFGSPQEVLTIESKTIQPPKEQEVLVRMSACPINPSDLIPIRGSYANRISLPAIPGYEGVGVVEAIGPRVSPHLIGKRVLPLRGEGTWKEIVKTSAHYTVPIPDSIDDVTAAQLYINPLTAWAICTDVLQLSADDVLVVNACGSSIGRIFVQLSKVLGFRLIAVTRNNRHTEDLLQLGASDVIDTSQVALYEAVMTLTNGRGATAAIDSIGGSSGTALAFCVRPNGRFITIGLLSGLQVDWRAIAEEAKVHANIFHLRHWNQKVSTIQWQETFQILIQLVEDQKLEFLGANALYDLSAVKKAVKFVECSNRAKGKVFLSSNYWKC